MILTCPACQTQYIVPEGALGAKSRTVKCAACHYSWRQHPITVTEIDLQDDELGDRYPDDDEISSSPALTEQAATSSLAHDAADMARQLRWQQALQADVAVSYGPTVSLPRFALRTVGWFALLLLFTAIALTYMRATLVTTWPGTALFFEELGVAAPAAGATLKFEDDIKAVLDTSSIPARLHVSGRFSNKFDRAVALPVLQARLFDKEGQWLKDWAIPLQNVGHVGGNGTMAFDYTLPQVPLEAYRLTFRFVDE